MTAGATGVEGPDLAEVCTWQHLGGSEGGNTALVTTRLSSVLRRNTDETDWCVVGQVGLRDTRVMVRPVPITQPRESARASQHTARGEKQVSDHGRRSMDPRSGNSTGARSQKPDLLKGADGPHSRCCTVGESDAEGGRGNTVLGETALRHWEVLQRACRARAWLPSKLGHRSTDEQDRLTHWIKRGRRVPLSFGSVVARCHFHSVCCLLLVKCLSCAIRRPSPPPIPRRPHPLPHRPNHIATLEPPGKPPLSSSCSALFRAPSRVSPPGPQALFSLQLQTSSPLPPRQQRCESPRLTSRRALAGTSLDASCSLRASSSPPPINRRALSCHHTRHNGQHLQS